MTSGTARSSDAQRLKLEYMLLLRQTHAGSEALRLTYRRLAEAVSTQGDKALPTIILDWLEAELRSPPPGTDNFGSRLIEETVRLIGSLKQ